MKRRLLSIKLLLSLVLMVAVIAAHAIAEQPHSGTWKGQVSDQKCGRNVNSDCTKKCLQAGEQPVLVVDNTSEVLLLSPGDLFRTMAASTSR
jgi:predicted carbohydrate-binding protein with CBM5 and CBM33 domain